jgi:hypothetical protein
LLLVVTVNNNCGLERHVYETQKPSIDELYD